MCNCNSLVRWVAVLILIAALLACLVGLVAPFWAYYDPGLAASSDSIPADSDPISGSPDAAVDRSTSSTPSHKVQQGLPGLIGPAPASKPVQHAAHTEGLWARCDGNKYWEMECVWFWQNDFQLENEFPVWHKAAQILYIVGAFILLATLTVACFNVCCCRCCVTVGSSLPIALAVLVVIAALPVLASISVYGAFAYSVRNVALNPFGSITDESGSSVSDQDATSTASAPIVAQTTTPNYDGLQGSVSTLDWAYFVAIGSVPLCLIAAALLLCDGCCRRDGVPAGGDDRKGQYEQAATNVEAF